MLGPIQISNGTMKALEFKEVNTRIAKDQKEYETLPAYYNNENGSITYGFKLTPEELQIVAKTGEIWLKQMTFGKPMQPIASSIIKEELLELTLEDIEREIKGFFPERPKR